MDKEKTISVEENLKDLDGIIQEMENENLTLEDSLKKFEAGVQLVRATNELLEEAEKRIKVLTESGDLNDF